MYHRVDSLAEQERVLKQVLDLQSQIRTKRERQRKRKSYDSKAYTKIFEPVTKSIEKLTLPRAPSPPAPQIPAPPGPSIKTEPEEEYWIEEPKTEEPELYEVEPKIEEPDLYEDALSEVPRRYRDDGMLGLNPATHQIGNYVYEVRDNVLYVSKYEELKQFHITDLDLWKLLLVLNPSKANLKLKDHDKMYLPYVHEYATIAHELDLLDSYSGSKSRAKYKILTDLNQHGGSGTFLYSSVPPPVILPSDKKGLMSELYKALAELRAGNTAMRNLVVPLAHEASRRRLLPPGLLTPDEETWVLA